MASYEPRQIYLEESGGAKLRAGPSCPVGLAGHRLLTRYYRHRVADAAMARCFDWVELAESKAHG